MAEKCVAVIDTTFARVDMGYEAERVLLELLPGYRVRRYTVPGIKDLPGAAKRALDSGCEAAITLGWVGRREADKLSYLAASVGLVMVEILTGKILVDVTVHEDEAEDEAGLKKIALERTRDHARNLALMLRQGPRALTPMAGKGVRQGLPDAGPIL